MLVTLYVVHVTRAPAACARIPLVSEDRITASPRACLPLARESRSSLATASSRRRARVQKKKKEKMGEGAGDGGRENKNKKNGSLRFSRFWETHFGGIISSRYGLVVWATAAYATPSVELAQRARQRAAARRRSDDAPSNLENTK